MVSVSDAVLERADPALADLRCTGRQECCERVPRAGHAGLDHAIGDERQLARIGGLNQVVSGIASVFVPPLGALAFETLPLYSVLAIDIGTAVLAIAPLCFISIPRPPAAAAAHQRNGRPSVVADIRTALRFVWGSKALLLVVALGIAVNTSGRAAGALQPLLVSGHFQGGALELGWLQAAAGLGALCGGITLGLWGYLRRRVIVQLLALALDGIAIIAGAAAPADALVAMYVSGFLEAVVLGLSGAIFQAIVLPELQRRLFELLRSAVQAITPLGLLVAGPVADAVGVRWWWVVTGLSITMLSVSAVCVPAMVHLEDQARGLPVGLRPER